MFYAQSTGGFYSRDIHGADIPADSIEITHAEHAELMAGQSGGRQIVAGARGEPRLADRPEPPRADLVLQILMKARELRLPIMSVLDGMQVSALTLSNTAQAQAIETAKQALRDITQIDLSGHATRDQMAAAVYGRYSQIRDAMPSALRAVFAQVVQ